MHARDNGSNMHACMTYSLITLFIIPGKKALITLNIILIKLPDDTVCTQPCHRRHLSRNVLFNSALNNFQILFHLVIRKWKSLTPLVCIIHFWVRGDLGLRGVILKFGSCIIPKFALKSKQVSRTIYFHSFLCFLNDPV